MAVLRGDLNHSVVQYFLGVIDFYCWRGLLVARKWPRPPVQPGTPAQVETWNNFREMWAWWKLAPNWWHTAWTTLDPPPGKTSGDMRRRTLLWLIVGRRKIYFPVVKAVQLKTLYTPQSHLLTIRIDTAKQTHEPRDISWRYQYYLPGTRPSYAYIWIGRSLDRNGYACRDYADAIELYHRPLHQWYLDHTGSYYVEIVANPQDIALIPYPNTPCPTRPPRR